MNDILNDKRLCTAILKYKDVLEGYTYVPEDNIDTIPINSHIQYIEKNNFKKKGGVLKLIRDSCILEIRIFDRGKCYIYISKYYIFFKKKFRSSLKNTLKDLVDNDFNLA
jgi:hypothetical protein